VGFGGAAPQSALLSRPMALTFVCQACFTRMQAVDTSGLPVTKCSKCWSPNLKPEGMPDEPAGVAGAPPPAAVPPVPPELVELFDRMFSAVERRKAAENERGAALDEAEEQRRERVTVAATNALDAIADLARATTSFVKSLVVVPAKT